MKTLAIPPSHDCFHAIDKAYGERHRYYHTHEHIDAMLKHFDSVYELAEHPAELELAIWFHDVIYKPFSTDNELKSAEWAKEFLLASDYNLAGAERVFKLIMATLHNGTMTCSDEKLIVDIDLTILGTPPSVYDQFERNVRQEYKLVPKFIFSKKRKQLLKSFLEQPSIYHHDYFKTRYENQARENLRRAVERL